MIDPETSYTRQAFALIRVAWLPVSLAAILMTAPNTYLDMFYWELDWAYYLVSVLLMGVEFLLAVVFLRTIGVMGDRQKGRFGTYFVVYLATSLVIVVGFLVLIIPGLILMVRLVPALARAIASESGDIVETVRWSIQKTGPSQWRIARAFWLPLMCLGVAAIAWLHWAMVYAETAEVWPAYEWVSAIVLNLALTVFMIWLIALGVVVYRDLIMHEAPTSTVASQDPV